MWIYADFAKFFRSCLQDEETFTLFMAAILSLHLYRQNPGIFKSVRGEIESKIAINVMQHLLNHHKKLIVGIGMSMVEFRSRFTPIIRAMLIDTEAGILDYYYLRSALQHPKMSPSILPLHARADTDTIMKDITAELLRYSREYLYLTRKESEVFCKQALDSCRKAVVFSIQQSETSTFWMRICVSSLLCLVMMLLAICNKRSLVVYIILAFPLASIFFQLAVVLSRKIGLRALDVDRSNIQKKVGMDVYVVNRDQPHVLQPQSTEVCPHGEVSSSVPSQTEFGQPQKKIMARVKVKTRSLGSTVPSNMHPPARVAIDKVAILGQLQAAGIAIPDPEHVIMYMPFPNMYFILDTLAVNDPFSGYFPQTKIEEAFDFGLVASKGRTGVKHLAPAVKFGNQSYAYSIKDCANNKRILGREHKLSGYTYVIFDLPVEKASKRR